MSQGWCEDHDVMPVGPLALNPGSRDMTSYLMLTVTLGGGGVLVLPPILQMKKLRSLVLTFVLS